MANGTNLAVLLHDRAASKAVPGRVRIVHKPGAELLNEVTHLFILASAPELPQIADLIKLANQRHQLRVLFVREEADPWSLPQMLSRANLRIQKNVLAYSEPDIPRRVIAAWLLGAQEQLVAYALAMDDRLFVLSCAMKSLEVPFGDLPALKRIPKEERSVFEIADDGSYMYWPKADIHLDIEAMRNAIDPEWRKRSIVARLARDKRFGKAIAAVRKAHGLRQSDIEGLSERQVRRIEIGNGTTVGTLELLAKAHSLDLDAYLSEVASAAKVKHESQDYSAMVANEVSPH